jgi:hypothetical protein
MTAVLTICQSHVSESPSVEYWPGPWTVTYIAVKNTNSFVNINNKHFLHLPRMSKFTYLRLAGPKKHL